MNVRQPDIRHVTAAEFPAFCRGRGLKCTAQRAAVFAAVQSHSGHPSVDEIWSEVRRTVRTITRESVYRILNEFAEFGLVGRLDALAAARYDCSTAPHAHFICARCGAVADYPMPAGLKLPTGMPSDRRLVELRVTGICEACRAAERN